MFGAAALIQCGTLLQHLQQLSEGGFFTGVESIDGFAVVGSEAGEGWEAVEFVAGVGEDLLQCGGQQFQVLMSA